ncbi:MAG: hypothetical protein LBK70_00065 [Clostridiales bacterium]|nr:hypothetical protein [Clostridiales bacterium]
MGLFWSNAPDYLKGSVVNYGFFTFTASVTAWVDVVNEMSFTDRLNPGGYSDVKFTFSKSF